MNSIAHAWGLRRQFLHATELQIIHPVSNETVTFAAPLPTDLDAILRMLKTEYDSSN
jgi:23S rRNA pseudouridine1911/1915/1917 synthase